MRLSMSRLLTSQLSPFLPTPIPQLPPRAGIKKIGMAYMANTACFSCTFFLCMGYLQYFCSGLDEIRSGHWIHDNGAELVSAGDIFRLGFFTPNGTRKNRYVGIWYSSRPDVIVWVANRDKPISTNGSGTFGIDSSDGNFKVFDNISNDAYFSTNLSSSSDSSMTAKLLDNGNLVLILDRTSGKLWESFENPTDTFLPGMKMDVNLTLTSWLSKEDPAAGNFSFQLDADAERGYTIKNGFKPHWKSGGESFKSFVPSQMYILAATLLSGDLSNVSAKQVNNSRLLIRYNGNIEYSSWDFKHRRWLVLWSEPKGLCSVFKFCGLYSICKYSSDDKTPICECLPGYEPTGKEGWQARKFSQGCRKKSVECLEDNTTFVQMNLTMVFSNTPYFKLEKEAECLSICQHECSCRAYSSPNMSVRNLNLDPKGCWFWYDSDFQEGFSDGGDHHILFGREDHTVSVGLSPGELAENQRRSLLLQRVVIAASVSFAVALLCCISYISYRRVVAKRKDQKVEENLVLDFYDNENLRDPDDQFTEEDKKDIDVPFFDLETILAATDNFSQAYKLGQGGFGPVYKMKNEACYWTGLHVSTSSQE